jgi:hypothetical protein
MALHALHRMGINPIVAARLAVTQFTLFDGCKRQ